MKRNYFGTDGVRGPYGGPVINEEFAARLAAAAVHWLQQIDQRGGSVGRVLIGRDTRVSGVSLEMAIATGLQAAGAEPVSLGVLPTPAVSRAVQATDARLGVVITASHNPACDNGIKFFGPNGMKLTDEDEVIIEGFLGLPIEADAPTLEVSEESISDYISAARSFLPDDSLAGSKIVLDTANGATSATSPTVLSALGADVTRIGDAPNGTNINTGVGSEHPELLAEKVLATGARLGIAHDGDGDRCVLCDELGGVLDGDEILTILAVHALRHDKLPKKTLVVTVLSNLGVDAAINALGGQVLRTSVGDRYVIERMNAEGAELGGETSGHIICADVATTGDGLMAALKVIEVMHTTGQPLSQLRKVLQKYPQGSTALRVEEKRDLDLCSNLTETIAALESELGDTGRLLVRYSGTEAKLRLLVEALTDEIVKDGLTRLEMAARRDLKVL